MLMEREYMRREIPAQDDGEQGRDLRLAVEACLQASRALAAANERLMELVGAPVPAPRHPARRTLWAKAAADRN